MIGTPAASPRHDRARATPRRRRPPRARLPARRCPGPRRLSRRRPPRRRVVRAGVVCVRSPGERRNATRQVSATGRFPLFVSDVPIGRVHPMRELACLNSHSHQKPMTRCRVRPSPLTARCRCRPSLGSRQHQRHAAPGRGVAESAEGNADNMPRPGSGPADPPSRLVTRPPRPCLASARRGNDGVRAPLINWVSSKCSSARGWRAATSGRAQRTDQGMVLSPDQAGRISSMPSTRYSTGTAMQASSRRSRSPPCSDRRSRCGRAAE